MGIEIPKIEVRFEDLTIQGNVYVGSRALPTLFNATINTIEVIFVLLVSGYDFRKFDDIINLVVMELECSRIDPSHTTKEEEDSNT